MKTFIHALLISFVFALFSAANADDKEKILVHFTGFVKKPGSYRVATKMTMQEIRDTCGGLNEFGTTKHMMIIRFPRAEGSSEDLLTNPDKRKDEILRLNQIPKEGDHYLLKDGDIVYIPAKYVIGR
jgi:protein involved in polysaccharide export with SLBB domain